MRKILAILVLMTPSILMAYDRPDIRALSFNCAPEAMLWGQSFTADTRILNPAFTSFTVKYYLSLDATITSNDILLRTWTVPPGVTGERVTLTLPNTPPAGAGRSIYLGLIVDADNVVVEGDESNNRNQGFGVDSRVINIGPPEAWADGTAYSYYTMLSPESADCHKYTGYQFVDPPGTSGNTWSIVAGSLPPGITMTSAGFVSGTPTVPGTYFFMLQASGGQGTRTYHCQMVVNPPRSQWFEDAKLGYWIGFYTSDGSNVAAIESENAGYNAASQIAAAVNAGAKYVVFTAFDGHEVRYWPSQVPAASSPKTNRDFVKEVITAAHNAGIKVLLYFGIDPHGGGEFNTGGDSVTGYQLWERKLIQELAIKGADGFWFDGAYFTQQSYGNSYFWWMWPELEAVIRRGNPQAILITNPGAVKNWWNLDDQGWGWKNEGPADVDVRVFEQFMSRTQANPPLVLPAGYNFSPIDQYNYFVIPWPQDTSHTLYPKRIPAESSALLGKTWAWSGTDADYLPAKTGPDLLNYLVRCWSAGVTVDFATGCLQNGVFNTGDQAAMNAIGSWMNTYGEAVYNTRSGSTLTGNAAQIYTTKKTVADPQYPQGREDIYVFVLSGDRPTDTFLKINTWPGQNTVLACYDVKNPATPLAFTAAGPILTIDNVAWNQDQTPTVLRVETAIVPNRLVYRAVASGTLNDWNPGAAIDTTYEWMINGSSDGHFHRSLLKFPSTPELAGKTIDHASLNMFYGYSGGGNPNLPLTVFVSTLQNDWSNATTWLTQPAIHTANAGGMTSLPIAATGWTSWDATPAVQEWANGLANRSLQIRGDEGIVIDNPGWQVLKYIYQAAKPNYEPWLEITVQEPEASTTVSGTIDLHDFVGDATMIPVSIELRSVGTSTPIESHVVLPDTEGRYAFTTASKGTYDLAAKASHWLRQVLTSVDSTANVSADFSLTNGDINGDNAINFSDYLVLSQNFGTSGPSGDLNGDGTVNFSDYLILSQSFGRSGTASTQDAPASQTASAELRSSDEETQTPPPILPCTPLAMMLMAVVSLGFYGLGSCLQSRR